MKYSRLNALTVLNFIKVKKNMSRTPLKKENCTSHRTTDGLKENKELKSIKEKYEHRTLVECIQESSRPSSPCLSINKF